MYAVFTTGVFEEKISKSEPVFQKWVKRIIDHLAKNPFVGKPLGAKWFREKKFGHRRIYYIIYEDMKAVYLVNLSDKKDQQAVINSIWLLLDEYKKEIESRKPV